MTSTWDATRKVWIVAYNCRDPYCGCPGSTGEPAMHLAGVWETRKKAEAQAAQLKGREVQIAEADVE